MPKGPGTYGSKVGRPPKKKKKKVKKQWLEDYTAIFTLNAKELPQVLVKRCVNPELKALLQPLHLKRQKKLPKKGLDNRPKIWYNRSYRDNHMASIDQETEQYYNKYFDLFRTPGWKQLIEELQHNALVINNVEATKDQNDLYVRKGQLNVLAYILNFETTTNNNYEELTANDQSI